MENSLQALKNIFARFVHFLPEEWDRYEQHIEPVEFRKRTFLTRQGEVENYVYFITQGSLRQYFVRNDREICLDFGFRHNLVSSYVSFLTREPSLVAIQAITDIKALRVDFDTVQQLNGSSKNSERFGRLIAEQLYITKLKREMVLLSMSAEEKYRHLMTNQPDFIQIIPVKDIASYLGIHPESLSRIRKNISAIS
ncbi:MAG: Crp/Fnr family transcriptional regulator [Cytophagaceae bacterium]|nr:Crp/Fnr family transcriptional regulator [Cytophagaceae bacterium]